MADSTVPPEPGDYLMFRYPVRDERVQASTLGHVGKILKVEPGRIKIHNRHTFASGRWIDAKFFDALWKKGTKRNTTNMVRWDGSAFVQAS